MADTNVEKGKAGLVKGPEVVAAVGKSRATVGGMSSSSPTRTSHLPEWLKSSFKSVEKFEIQAKKTRDSIKLLRDTCKKFDELKRMTDLYFEERERLFKERMNTTKKGEISAIETLPAEIYGRLMCFFSAEDVLEWYAVSKILRRVMRKEDSKCWQPYSVSRWNVQNPHKDSVFLLPPGEETSFRASCLARAMACHGAFQLLLQFRHGRIPENGGGGRGQRWTNALTGLVVLSENKLDRKTREKVMDVGGIRFLLQVASSHNSHLFRRMATGIVANLLVTDHPPVQTAIEEQVERYNGPSLCRELLCSPTAQVEAMTSQEAARLLINLKYPQYSILASASDILAVGGWKPHQRGSSAASHSYDMVPGEQQLRQSPFQGNDGRLAQGAPSIGEWNFLTLYQSGSLKCREDCWLQFFPNGAISGQGIDTDRGMWHLKGTWMYTELFGRPHQDFESTLGALQQEPCGNGSLVMQKYFGPSCAEALQKGVSVNYRGFWTGKDGFFGVWENETGEHYKDMRLRGGGVFRAVMCVQ